MRYQIYPAKRRWPLAFKHGVIQFNAHVLGHPSHPLLHLFLHPSAPAEQLADPGPPPDEITREEYRPKH